MPIVTSAYETRLRGLRGDNEPLISRPLPGLDEDTREGGALRGELLLKSRPEDSLRLTRLLASPSGVKYATNQALIAGTTAILGAGKDWDSNIVKNTTNFALKSIPTAIGQALVNGTGVHLGDELFISYYPADTPLGILGDRIKSNFVKNTTTITPTGYNTDTPDEYVSYRKVEELENKSYLKSKYRIDDIPSQFTNGNRVKELKVESNGVTSFNAFRPDPATPNKTISPIPTGSLNGEEIPTKTKRDGFLRLNRNPSLSQAGSTTPGSLAAADKLNFLGIQNEELDEAYDYIPFKIVLKAPDEPDQYLYFRAYLDSLSDSFDATWNTVNYIGRAENFYTYNGFSRDISFSFMIAAHTELELLPLYQKLNRLVSTTAPSYSSLFMRGVFTRLTIGDYLYNTPGFFKSIGLTWETSYPWETNSKGRKALPGTKLQTPRVPHLLKVQCTYQPVHDFAVEYKKPFLLNEDYINYNTAALT